MTASAVRRAVLILGITLFVTVTVAYLFLRGSVDDHDDEDMLAGAKNVEVICRLLSQFKRQQNISASMSAPSVLASYQAFVATAKVDGTTRFADTAQDALRELTAVSTMTSTPSDMNSDAFTDIYRRTLRVRIAAERMTLACALQGQIPGGTSRTTVTPTAQKT